MWDALTLDALFGIHFVKQHDQIAPDFVPKNKFIA